MFDRIRRGSCTCKTEIYNCYSHDDKNPHSLLVLLLFKYPSDFLYIFYIYIYFLFGTFSKVRRDSCPLCMKPTYLSIQRT